jgi:hypothetical protein
MSRTVRLSDYLYAEVERLAKEERRSLANMVQVLLEQALALNGATMQGGGDPPRSATSASGGAGAATPPASGRAQAGTGRVTPPDSHFKPDPKK